MAKNRSSGTALALSGRWLGGGAVALVHLAFLLALLATDHLTFRRPPDGRAITVYHLPDDAPAYSRQTLHAMTPPAMAAPSSVLAPRLDGPMILIQPEKPLPPTLRGLDLSVKPSGTGLRPLTQEDLLPSEESRLKQFYRDTAEANRLFLEPPAGEECKYGLTRDSSLASLGDSAFKDPIPMTTQCTPKSSAKALSKRNQRFAPQ